MLLLPLNRLVPQGVLPGLFFIGLCFLALTGCIQTAEKSPDKVSTSPDAATIEHNNRGVGLMGFFDYQKAHEVFKEVVDKNPDWHTGRINLGIATLNLQSPGSEQEALNIMEAVLAENPDELRARYCAGLIKTYMGQTEQAQADFELVAKADPQDAYAAYYLGQMRSKSGDFEGAETWYKQAIELDPYLRSAYFGLFQTYQRMGKADKAKEMLADFQKLEGNPKSRLVEFKYTRMGPKASAHTADSPQKPELQAPSGPLFGEPVPLPLPDGYAWNPNTSSGGLSVCDFNHDGNLDLFASGAWSTQGQTRNGIYLGDGSGNWTPQPQHPLAQVQQVKQALWGDWNNDNLTDVYFLGAQTNLLWTQTKTGWEDQSAATQTAMAAQDSQAGLWLDADHDGDLDLFIVDGQGANSLLNNNMDGTFRPLAAERGLEGHAASRAVLAADFDRDRDTDLVVLDAEGRSQLFVNDRLWQYRAEWPQALSQQGALAGVTTDIDADGFFEMLVLSTDGTLLLQYMSPDRQWQTETLGQNAAWRAPLAVVDSDGDGQQEVLVTSDQGIDRLALSSGGSVAVALSLPNLADWHLAALDPSRGPSLLIRTTDGSLAILPPGSGRYGFCLVSFSGKTQQSDGMRSNASGIGTRFAARMGSQWVAGHSLPQQTGSQSLQPNWIGMGNHNKIDFLAMTWSDGVFQTELGLEKGQNHAITETQRQLSSCPVLFAWDGQKFQFISDLLGVGGLGFFIEPGTYATPRPWEHFLLPQNLLQPRDGKLVLQIAEPMEEACYLDHAQLKVVDLPPGFQMTLDERMGTGSPTPSGRTIFYRETLKPTGAWDGHNNDVLGSILDRDQKAMPLPPNDARFLGILQEEQQLTLAFETALDRGPGRPVLLVDGWVEYPYSQTGFSAWQAGVTYQPPSLDALVDGAWQTVYPHFGYPAGMPRQMSLPLDRLPPGTKKLRLRTNLEVYWDRVAVVFEQECPQASIQSVALSKADLQEVGFALRTNGPQKRPNYDDNQRAPLWDTRHLPGFYTQFGEVGPLLEKRDDGLAVFGPGEAIFLEFEQPQKPVPDGWTRHLVLEVAGWAKDMDMYTQTGEQLGPLPKTGPETPQRAELHRKYHTRYRGGY